MDFIRQVISDFKPDLIMGLVLLLLGIIVPAFRLYWLIAGVNTASKELSKNIDYKYVGKYFGIFIGGLGFLLILIPFIFSYFGFKTFAQSALPFVIIIVVGFMLAFGSIKKNRINRQDID